MAGVDEEEDSRYVLTNREFRKIYREIMGDTKTQVNIKQAYTVTLSNNSGNSNFFVDFELFR